MGRRVGARKRLSLAGIGARMFPLNVVKSPSRKGEIPPMTINGTATPSHGTPRGPRDTSPSFPPKKCLVPREIPLAAVVSRSDDDDDDDARLHYRDLYHFRLRMRYDSAPLARSLARGHRQVCSVTGSLLARSGKGWRDDEVSVSSSGLGKEGRPPSLLFLHFAPAPSASVHHRPGRSARSPPPGARRARTDGQRRSNQEPAPLVGCGGGREGAGAGRRSREEGREGDRGCGMERSYH